MERQILANLEKKMQISLEVLGRELASIRTGRASPALVEHVKVEYAGVLTPLKQIAGISVPQAKLLVIQPWDRGSLNSIEKAILKSDLGLTPLNDGNVIRLNIPPITEEGRQQLVKMVHKRVEDGKIAIRNLRHEGVNELKGLEKNKEISQDAHKHALGQLQKLTDNFTHNAEQIGLDKEAELTEV